MCTKLFLNKGLVAGTKPFSFLCEKNEQLPQPPTLAEPYDHFNIFPRKKLKINAV